MKITKAKTSDVSALFSLEKELFNSKNFPLSKGSFYYHTKNNLILLVKIQEILAGYILVLTKRKVPKLYSIGVKESFRGSGISKKLLDKATLYIKDLGFKKFILEVRVDNSVAISLYEKSGFRVLKTLKAFYKDGCDAYLMEFNCGIEEL